jgi:ribosomal protein L18E
MQRARTLAVNRIWDNFELSRSRSRRPDVTIVKIDDEADTDNLRKTCW